jgi:folate-binding protein YgfZ
MTHALTTPLNGIAALPHWGVIRVEGADAATFLHGQLTQDFALLGMSGARLAAHCTAKGRMLTSFIGIKRSPTEVLLVCLRDAIPAARQRLSMFVLRAKAKLSDASADFQLLGLAGTALDGYELPAPPMSRIDVAGATLIRLHPADGVARALWLAAPDVAAPAAPLLDLALWQWGEVRSAVPLLGPAVSEAFVPQMLNYESVGGVNFKKGCYPGQEVVARSQYRGILKRRAYLVHADLPLTPAWDAGSAIHTPTDAAQPCGTVVQAAAAPQGGVDAIVSLQVSAAEAGELRLGAADGPALSLLPLPYELLKEVV